MTASRRYDVHLVALDPVRGSEIAKTRPAVIVSPDEMTVLRVVIVAPLTSTAKAYPTRVPCRFGGKDGWVALDQLRAVDRTRLVRRLGAIEAGVARAISETLVEMFRP